ncbi:GNAT family N-acetyltransferase [Paenibacillus methanolicus]|uniref:Ribosomal protein S18 acetylase RimI-like enzyme n=1 Tax=Paenibacillus methanolicus TaxID=582686 RepID=A0A5S5C2X1_9BACL|nr:GNAT family N-acetyltransferase [Paenibacillus methanolicus]TYP73771.1 ribosomal protein S18 acetylase RimI-like enzyme [Paenibacillus methanolicus]
MEIVPYERRYLADVAELVADLGYPIGAEETASRIAALETEDTVQTYVAVRGESGLAVGLICLRLLRALEYANPIAQVSLLVVKEEEQGVGIGQALMAFADQWAIRAGAESVVLTSGIKPERERAHAFYKRQGYAVTGYRFGKSLT